MDRPVDPLVGGPVAFCRRVDYSGRRS